MKLELKHLAPYLPYGLKCELTNYQSDYVGEKYGIIIGYYIINGIVHYKFKDGCAGKDARLIKPILHPLSELTKEIKVDGEKFVPIYKLADCDYYDRSLRDCIANYQHLKNKLFWDGKLFEWHFDVFGLIEKGLAIDKNTLQS